MTSDPQPPDADARAEPPDDPDEEAEFEEWTYFENGKPIMIKRPNPKYKPR
jgi:hypothetical protein